MWGQCCTCVCMRGACTCGKCVPHEKRPPRITHQKTNERTNKKKSQNDFASVNVIFKKTEKKNSERKYTESGNFGSYDCDAINKTRCETILYFLL